MRLAQQLRAFLRRLNETHYARDRNIIFAEMLPLLEKIAARLEEKPERPGISALDADLAKLLASLGKGSKFPGREFYINNSREFDRAARGLIEKTGFEEIKL